MMTAAIEQLFDFTFFVFNFHESYHAGQVGLLRRLLGLPGVIQ
jgi:hypothetical protein